MLSNYELELTKLTNNINAVSLINQEIEDLLEARKRLLDDQEIIIIRLKVNKK